MHYFLCHIRSIVGVQNIFLKIYLYLQQFWNISIWLCKPNFPIGTVYNIFHYIIYFENKKSLINI